jgi:hypothetical protein
MVQLPAVFALFAPPNRKGVKALDAGKSRIPGKNYGSAIGSLSKYFSNFAPNALPSSIKMGSQLSFLDGSFIHVRFTDDGFNSPTIRNGTHLGLIMPDGVHRKLYTMLEMLMQAEAEPDLYNGKHFTAPICTSANLSGDPLGSITTMERAFAFVESRDIPLFLTYDGMSDDRGSFPIFSVDGSKVKIIRNGPGQDRIRAGFPPEFEFLD